MCQATDDLYASTAARQMHPTPSSHHQSAVTGGGLKASLGSIRGEIWH